MKSELNSAWTIEDSGTSEESIIQNGNRMFTGNGFMGFRGTVDEADKRDMTGLIVNGIYDQNGDKWREPVNFPNPLFIRLLYCGEGLTLRSESLKKHQQSLNFRYGLFERKTEWSIKRPDSEVSVCVESCRFLSMSHKNLLCLEYKISASQDISLDMNFSINADVYDANGPHFEILARGSKKNKGKKQSIESLLCRTLEKKKEFALSRITNLTDNSIFLKAGEPLTIKTYAAVFTELDTQIDNCKEIFPAAQEEVLQAEKEGFEKLLKNHKAAWDLIWEDGDIQLEGDEEAQRNLRYSLYHLQSIAPRGRKALSIPARGLSAQTYKGAIFWDTELFIFPYFLYTEPAVAREFLEYRIKTLEGAKRKARQYGYEGAFYAWESQENGDDACSDYNVTDVFTKRPVRTYFRDKQIHINAAIIYSICQYVEVTADDSILQAGGYEVIFECAKFYLSRCIYLPLKNQYEIHDVIGPDEYHERVNNNAYTNRMILFSLQKTQEFAKKSPEIAEKTGFKAFIKLAEDVCKKLYIPSPSKEEKTKGVIPQFDSYFDFEDSTLETVRSRLLDPKEYWGGANGVASHTQIIKQADTVTMLNLFSDDYEKEILRANYDYYKPRTEHGSTLSACMYGLLACKISRISEALSFFEKTSSVDLSGKSKQWAGLIYIGGTHPAAQGGSWMMTVYGFCGFSVKSKKIQIEAQLPKNWKKVSFTTIICGEKFKVNVTKDGYDLCRK